MELAVALRDKATKKSSALRKMSIIPGVVYGKNTKDPVHVSFAKNEFLKLYRYAGTSTVIDLK